MRRSFVLYFALGVVGCVGTQKSADQSGQDIDSQQLETCMAQELSGDKKNRITTFFRHTEKDTMTFRVLSSQIPAPHLGPSNICADQSSCTVYGEDTQLTTYRLTAIQTHAVDELPTYIISIEEQSGTSLQTTYELTSKNTPYTGDWSSTGALKSVMLPEFQHSLYIQNVQVDKSRVHPTAPITLTSRCMQTDSLTLLPPWVADIAKRLPPRNVVAWHSSSCIKVGQHPARGEPNHQQEIVQKLGELGSAIQECVL